MGDALQVFLILDSLRFPGGNDLVQQSGHFLEKGRVVEVFLDDLATDVIFDGLGNRILVPLQATELLRDSVRDARVYDQVQQTHIVERRDLPWAISLNVGVDEVPHIGFIGFEVQAFATGLADNLAKSKIMLKLTLDARNVRPTVSGSLQFIGNVGVGADKRCGRFVERSALWFAFL